MIADGTIDSDAAPRLLRRGAFVTAIATAIATLVLRVGSASADMPNSTPAESYARQFDVPAAEAERRLTLQDRARGVVEALQGRLGEHYAGVWFDNSKGEFVLPVVPEADRTDAIAFFAERDLDSDFRTQEVDSTWDELVASQARLTTALRPLFAERLVQTGIDTSVNAVVVELASGASEMQKSQVRSQAAGEPADVQVRIRDIDRFDVDPLACVFPNCDKPLRGGVRIDTPGSGGVGSGTCTSGFLAFRNDNLQKMFLTAGHCVTPSNGQGRWLAYQSDWTSRWLDWPYSWQYGVVGDMAAIDVDGTWWEMAGWPPVVYFTWGDLQHQIWNVYGSYVGLNPCHTGQTTGSSCGYVDQLNQTVTYSDGTKVGNLTRVAGDCRDFGDSGGPWVGNHAAFGIMSGGSPVPGCGSGHSYYTEIVNVDDYLNVHVATAG